MEKIIKSLIMVQNWTIKLGDCKRILKIACLASEKLDFEHCFVEQCWILDQTPNSLKMAVNLEFIRGFSPIFLKPNIKFSKFFCKSMVAHIGHAVFINIVICPNTRRMNMLYFLWLWVWVWVGERAQTKLRICGPDFADVKWEFS
jgi:hypothetical protein